MKEQPEEDSHIKICRARHTRRHGKQRVHIEKDIRIRNRIEENGKIMNSYDT